VQLTHELTKHGIHRRLDTSREFHGIGQQMPEFPILHLKPGHGDFATARSDDTLVGELAAATGVKRRCREQDRPWPRRDDLGFEAQDLRILVTKVERHYSYLFRCWAFAISQGGAR
jgi:hypothetical protein